MISALYNAAYGQHQLPHGWSWHWLDEVMDIRGGAQPEASTFVAKPRAGYVRFVQIRDFDTDGHLTYIEDSNKWRKCSKDDILIARYGASLGRILRGIEGAYNVALVKAEPTNVETPFLYYLLRSHFFQGPIIQSGARSAQAGFNKRDLSVIPVPVPPASEQRAIARVLGALDAKIELNAKMSATLEAIARALFKSWFVDFDPVRAKAEGHDPGLPPEIAALFPDTFEDSELGEIPKGWGVRAFTDMVEVIGGGTPRTAVAAYWNGDIPWFSVADAPPDSDVWVVSTEKSVTASGLANSSTRLLHEGTTIISARGTVGRVALAGVPLAMNQSCYGLCGKAPFGISYVYFSTRAIVQRLRQRAHGSVFDTITRNTLNGIQVAAPLDNIVDVFERTSEPMLERIRSGVVMSETLSGIRDSLLPKLISGEIRVTDAERIVEKSA